MSVCPNCHKTNDPHASECSECHQTLKEDIYATIDHDSNADSNDSNRQTMPVEVGSVDSSMDFEAEGLNTDDPSKKTITTIDLTESPLVTNAGTVVARENFDNEVEQTVIAENSDASDISRTQVSPQTDFTIDLTFNSEEGPLPLDATINLSDEPVDSLTDEQATILFDTDGPRDLKNDQTIIFGTEGTDHVTNATDGTQGRLKRMWEGAVGSSANPMHSLSAIALQASDTIFERVATRKVLDANATLTPDADYKIVNKLGEGAMGIVFTARQTTVDRLVALKTAKPKFQKNEDARRRFLYEAQITADLDHSNIVPIYELGSSEEGMLFYSMKIVQGDQWSRVMSEKSREQNLDIFMNVADAVAFAHSKGIIHRDLKPENTMLGLFGEVFVTDWGTAINLKKDSSPIVATGMAEDRRLALENTEHFRANDSILIVNDDEVFERNEVSGTNGNELLLRKKLSRTYKPSQGLRVVKAINMAGTPCYMAPEMAGHQLHRLGRCSDIYVLGGILFDMITGRPPHSGPTVTHCLKHALDNELKPPESSSDDALLKIALKAMSTHPKDRYQSVGEMQDAIRIYRRHAESISLGNRSLTLLQNARATGDYETFSRALFGFRDAIEMWPDNTSAKSGLVTARREYGEVAYGKGDYDLVLQTVDRSHEDENVLYEQAVEAKQRRVDRELGLKRLQRAVAVIVLSSVAGLSGLSLYALSKKNLAEQNEAIAKTKEDEANRSAEVAKAEKQKAEDSERVAKKAAEDEALAKQQAQAAEQVALNEKANAVQSANEAVEARKKEEAANLAAQAEKQLAIQAREEASKQRDLAEKRSIDIQLDEYKSSLPLALSQLASFDLKAARENIARLRSISDNFVVGAQPAFDTWGWQRVNLLSNYDLPRVQVGKQPLASASSRGGDNFAIATGDGNVQLFTAKGKQIERVSGYLQANASDFAMTMSDDGNQLAFAYSGTKEAGIKYWRVGSASPMALSSAAGHRVQALAFTPDGRTLVAGINAGVWVWNVEGDWTTAIEPTRKIEKVRGSLVNLQSISMTQFLMTVDFQNQREIRLLDIADVSNTEIKLPESIQGLVSQALMLEGGQQIAIGLTDNRLAVLDYQTSSNSLTNVRFLENRHTAAITELHQDKSGRLISSSNAEPAAQVWHLVQGQWLHLCSLSGLPGNLQDVLLVDSNQTIGVDDSGECLLWSIDRQMQRSRMQRTSRDGQRARYVAPVQQLSLGKFNEQALAIDANGVIDRWNLVDGTSETLAGERFSYIGHTPGAELVDTVVDEHSSVVVTAARLQNSQRDYLSDPNATWEFCLWDLKSSAMLRRWTRSDDSNQASVEPRLSLIDQGRKLLIASDTETRIQDLATGKDFFFKQDFGTYFAVPCPTQESLLLLVKRSGAVRFVDLSDVQAWNSRKIDDDALRTSGDTPLKAVWSADGKRIYIAYASGNVVQLGYEGGQVQMLWSSFGSENASANNRLASVNGRSTSYLEMDLAVDNAATGELLQYAIRSTGTNDQTKHARIEFASNNSPKILSNNLTQGLRWLKQQLNGSYKLVTSLNDDFDVDSQRVKAWNRAGQKTYVSSRTTQTFVITDGRSDIEQFGRAPLLSAVGDSTGRNIYALSTDSSIWKFSVNSDNTSRWSKLKVAPMDVNKITLSPDSRYLALHSSHEIDVWDLTNQTLAKRLDGAVSVCWDSNDAQTSAVCFKDGSLKVYDQSWAVTRSIDRTIQADEQTVGVQVFHETWADPKQHARRHLMVHSRGTSNDSVAFYPIDPLPESVSTSAIPSASANLPINSKVTPSPRDGVFVVGTDNGTVSVWFCMPTWGGPRQLYELEGHRGAAITAMNFTTDGKTLVTADSKNRLFAWLSQDPTEIETVGRNVSLLNHLGPAPRLNVDVD